MLTVFTTFDCGRLIGSFTQHLWLSAVMLVHIHPHSPMPFFKLFGLPICSRCEDVVWVTVVSSLE